MSSDRQCVSRGVPRKVPGSMTFPSLDHNLPKISQVQHVNYPEKGQQNQFLFRYYCIFWEEKQWDRTENNYKDLKAKLGGR